MPERLPKKMTDLVEEIYVKYADDCGRVDCEKAFRNHPEWEGKLGWKKN